MPSLMLRTLPDALLARLRAYRDARQISLQDAAVQAMAAGLDHLEARRRGGLARAERLTPAQLSEIGRAGAKAKGRKA